MFDKKRIDRGLYWDRALTLVSGCQGVSEGCAHCWSRDETHTKSYQNNKKIIAQYGGVTDMQGRWNGKIKMLSQNLEKALKRKKATSWAVWNDLFYDDVTEEFIDEFFGVVASRPQHIFMALTKRPHNLKTKIYKPYRYINSNPDDERERALGTGDFYPNLWLGTTVELDKYKYRIAELLAVPAKVHYLSLEPLLGPIDLRGYLNDIELVIIGAESGKRARPMEENWVRDIINICKNEYNIPIFYKQDFKDGHKIRLPEIDGKRYAEFPNVG